MLLKAKNSNYTITQSKLNCNNKANRNDYDTKHLALHTAALRKGNNLYAHITFKIV